ncbi:putative serine/threonine-protein kinase PBL28 [Bidens hawaiensis]|uniref:putative serine/threonine-protein kinase PBL28 n=1 Tax=Bidens hawaiensis TaxID=980011 RepID=UPI00404B38A8
MGLTILSGSETAFIEDIVRAIICALDSKPSAFVSGDLEFWKEIMMLYRYTHRNLISLLGFCDEDGEKNLVYEHASNGSLDRHLRSTVLTWAQRLKICLDAARGLAYLHDDMGSQQRVLHRDIKSANILLDKNWNAKLSDMGLSKLGPANQRHTVLITNIVGTPGYCDPQYMETYSLTKESDIYLFGVVLFEVLCGRLCFDYTNGPLKILVPTNKAICIRNPTSLEIFSSTAFQCLHYDREQRPEISILVERLETALEFQKLHDINLAKAVRTP